MPFNAAHRRTLPALIAALVALLTAIAGPVAPVAGAGEALYLSWNDCPGGFGSSPNRVFGCGTNSGHEALIAYWPTIRRVIPSHLYADVCSTTSLCACS